MVFTSNSKAFVQSTSLPESLKLKLFSYEIMEKRFFYNQKAMSLSVLLERPVSTRDLQGYLAHKKLPPLRTLQLAYT